MICPRRDGADMTFWAQKIPLLDEDGDVDRILSVSIDISDLKAAQAQIERQQEALHQSEKLTALTRTWAIILLCISIAITMGMVNSSARVGELVFDADIISVSQHSS